MPNQWGPFEHLIWKNFKASGLEVHDSFVLAVSGGLDSMVLLEVFMKIKRQARVKVCYFHHGDSSRQDQQYYRDEAQKLVEHKISGLPGWTFHVGKNALEMDGEEQLRNLRWDFLRKVQVLPEVLVTAHHLDDRLETMLLKLIRGTSLDGFSAFKMWNQDIFRPFLNVTKAELLEYAETNKLRWLEDPSNKDDLYLRNWLREKWLPELDERVPGGSKNMAKSLLSILNHSTDIQSFELIYAANDLSALSRPWYLSLSKESQVRALAVFLRNQKIFNFTSGQLEEIRKRLDKNQKDITFDLVGKKWVINAMQIMLQ